MTLNGVMAIILPYFAEFGSFRGQLRESGWPSTDFLTRNVIKPPTKHDWRAVLFAAAELLVFSYPGVSNKCLNSDPNSDPIPNP